MKQLVQRPSCSLAVRVVTSRPLCTQGCASQGHAASVPWVPWWCSHQGTRDTQRSPECRVKLGQSVAMLHFLCVSLWLSLFSLLLMKTQARYPLAMCVQQNWLRSQPHRTGWRGDADAKWQKSPGTTVCSEVCWAGHSISRCGFTCFLTGTVLLIREIELDLQLELRSLLLLFTQWIAQQMLHIFMTDIFLLEK